MQTLARMTGKDFSGPPPVIKAPTPPRLLGEQADDGVDGDVAEPERGATPTVEGGEEIIGIVED